MDRKVGEWEIFVNTFCVGKNDDGSNYLKDDIEKSDYVKSLLLAIIAQNLEKLNKTLDKIEVDLWNLDQAKRSE